MKKYPYSKQSRVENNIELETKKDNVQKMLTKAGYKKDFVGKSHLIEQELLDKKKNFS